jgi:hypothetical protein
MLNLVKAPEEPRQIEDMAVDELVVELDKLKLAAIVTDTETDRLIQDIPELERRAKRVVGQLERVKAPS